MTTENFNEIILPALEKILVIYAKTGSEDIGKTLDQRFADYEKTPFPLECHNKLKELQQNKKKIDKKVRHAAIVRNAATGIKNHKIASVVVSLATVLTLVGCSSSISKTGGATDNNDQKGIVTILEGNKQIDHGSAWAENFATNGAYDENAKESSDMFAIATVLDSFANRDQYSSAYLDALALGANYNSREEVQAVGRSFFEVHQQIVLSKGEIKYEQVLQKEKDSKLLNELQEAWKNISATSSDESKEKFDSLIEDFVKNVNQYSPFAVRLGIEYVTMGYDTPWKGGTVVSKETVDLFYQNIENCCTTLYCASSLSKEKESTANSSLQSVSDTLLYGYVDDLLKDKTHDHIETGEKLYSYTEIRDGIADKIKDLKNSERDLEQAADEISMENFEQKAIEKFGDVEKVTPNDHITTNSKGEQVINNGNTVVENSTGDVKDGGAKDNNGNSSTVDKINHTFKEGYEDWINSNGAESAKKYPNDPTYMDGWNTAAQDIKNLQDQNKGPQTDSTTTEEHYNDVNTNTETQAPSTPSQDEVKETKPTTPTTPETPVPGEIVDIQEEEEIKYYSNDILGTDGNMYTDSPELGRSK